MRSADHPILSGVGNIGKHADRAPIEPTGAGYRERADHMA
jgi:hypothetical protein